MIDYSWSNGGHFVRVPSLPPGTALLACVAQLQRSGSVTTRLPFGVIPWSWDVGTWQGWVILFQRYIL